MSKVIISGRVLLVVRNLEAGVKKNVGMLVFERDGKVYVRWKRPGQPIRCYMSYLPLFISCCYFD